VTAIRFVGAGTPIGTGPAGAGLVVIATGSIATIAGDDSIRQAILLLLTTAPGERLMRPGYGSHLHRLLFSPNDDTTAGLAIHYVRQAIERWEPRVEILDVDATADSATEAGRARDASSEPARSFEPARLLLRLRYRVRASLAVEDLEHRIDLQSA
jgi:phage baseplate assembly protein W